MLLARNRLLTRNNKEYRDQVEKLTSVQVVQNIASLEKEIIPPPGTRLENVEAIFGKTEESDPSKEVKGDGRVYNYRELLPAFGMDSFRAILLLRVENSVVIDSGINHVCVVKNRRQVAFGTEYAKQVSRELEGERRAVLVDLLEIQDRYATALGNSSWRK